MKKQHKKSKKKLQSLENDIIAQKSLKYLDRQESMNKQKKKLKRSRTLMMNEFYSIKDKSFKFLNCKQIT